MRDPPYGRLLPHGSKCRVRERKHCNAIAMIIASRSLKITASEISDVVINIHAPGPARGSADTISTGLKERWSGMEPELMPCMG